MNVHDSFLFASHLQLKRAVHSAAGYTHAMYIKVQVAAGTRKESIEEIGPDRFAVRVKEAPEMNAANHRVIALIARQYGVPIARVRIVRGHRAPSKLLEIHQNLSQK